MKIAAAIVTLLFAFEMLAGAQAPAIDAAASRFRVILLGTAGGPTFNAQRQGIGTLVQAGPEILLFDAGRGITGSIAKLSITGSSVTKVFITHLHSDHVISLPELWLFPWGSQGRRQPLQVWGPQGTRAMASHLQEAFAFDVHIRRDVDERFSPEGVKLIATDIREGVVYDSNGVKVTAFAVDHGPVKPALGYRVDYSGRSVVFSGDTRPSDNLVKHSQGVDVLIHEVGRSKDDPALAGPPDEILPGGPGNTRGQMKTIAEHHTDAAELARILQRANPKLALISHANVPAVETLAIVKRSYSGRVEYGVDLMTIDIGEQIALQPIGPVAK